MADTKKIVLRIERTNGKTLLYFYVDKRITELFAKIGGEKQESTRWQDAKTHETLWFYPLGKILDNEKYTEKLREYNFTDSFGADLYEKHYLNIAFLRCASSSATLEVHEGVTAIELEMSIRNLIKFIKWVFEEFLTPISIKGEITLEI